MQKKIGINSHGRFNCEVKAPRLGDRVKLYTRLGKTFCETQEEAITKVMYDYSDMIYLTNEMLFLNKEIYELKDIYSHKYLRKLKYMLLKLKIDMIRTIISDNETIDRLGGYDVYLDIKEENSTTNISTLEKKVNNLFDSILTVVVLSPIIDNYSIIGYSCITTIHKKEEQDLIEERYNFLPLSSINNLCAYDNEN